MQDGLMGHGFGGVINGPRPITITFGDGINVVTSGNRPIISRCGIRGNISRWSISADVTGSCSIDVQKASASSSPNFISMVGNGGAPALSNIQANVFNVPLGWNTTSFVESDMLRFSITSITNVKTVSLTLEYQVN